ncbi:MAG: glycoside hydrolase family 3 C-terminal domain-containing protein [Oscillospiraceae bacterium]|nr:glycoside hydrolase family 3 C-terminal domain-containing protein [Oscillospiraceae bacterium]
MKAVTKAKPDNGVSQREADNRALAREAAAGSIVLLYNDGALPVAPCPVALFGAGAATTIKGGTGSGEVNERYSVSIEQGLKEAGFSITTDKWLREYETLLSLEHETYYHELLSKARRSSADDRINFMAEGFHYPFGRSITQADIAAGGDICIYVIARQAGECSDRKLDSHDFALAPDEIENLKAVASSYTKTILVINSGAPMDLSALDGIDGINAVLYFCQQGMEGGSAFADVITGAVTPSGCLSATWPRKYTDIPNAMEYSYLNGRTDHEEYKEGIYVGYRYFDSFGVKPAYCMGYGLSYTQFDIEPAGLRLDGSVLTAAVRVTNIGGRFAGRKTVQLYVSAPSGRLEREYQSLAAFAKTGVLEPGASGELELSFDFRDIAGYDTDAASFILERGAYIVRIGGNSMDTRIAALIMLDETVTTEVCRNICSPAQAIEEIHAFVPEVPYVPDSVPRLSLSYAVFVTVKHDYPSPVAESGPEIDAIMEKLSTADRLSLVLGTGMLGGKSRFKVPGAAAHTTSLLEHKGVPNAALCDGPAGLRLQKTSVRSVSGSVKPVDTAMRLLDSMPKVVKMFMYGNPDKGELLYQYASAFPVGTALAQTWDVALMERIGDAIGTEMVEYGVAFWLAPGMNIQRNPLCGRNFEYFSEDPLLTGSIAAAVIRGVQSHDGCYVTIKHFAANNQETNRNKSDSVMSERVLREIYLKGFRIAVARGGAKALMTSYNKINGVYTPNSYDLCTAVLRDEWGFDGVVMTDWFSTGKGLAGSGAAIKAGNDLIMPGGGEYLRELKRDLNSGALSLRNLAVSSSRVLKAVLGSAHLRGL